MPDGRIAEWMLSLVLPRERAAAVTGDLVEEAGHRGPVWFWLAVVRTMTAFLVRSLDWSVFPMAVAAACAWLLYIPVILVATPVLTVILRLVLGFGYFLTHHSIVELAIRVPLLRFDWPPMPLIAPVAAVFIMTCWGPWTVGRLVAGSSPGRELLAGIVAAAVWPLAATVLPLGRAATTGAWAIPLMLSSVIAGAIAERCRLTRMITAV